MFASSIILKLRLKGAMRNGPHLHERNRSPSRAPNRKHLHRAENLAAEPSGEWHRRGRPSTRVGGDSAKIARGDTAPMYATTQSCGFTVQISLQKCEHPCSAESFAGIEWIVSPRKTMYTPLSWLYYYCPGWSAPYIRYNARICFSLWIGVSRDKNFSVKSGVDITGSRTKWALWARMTVDKLKNCIQHFTNFRKKYTSHVFVFFSPQCW